MLRPFILALMVTPPIFSDKWLALSAGTCGIVRPKDRTPTLQVEYQPKPLIKPCAWFDIRPQAGFFLTFRVAGYIYGGVRFEFMPVPWIIITPGIAAGAYITGQGKKLHFPLEYKSSFEIAFQYKQNSRRLGVQFYHISNASVGFHNPGTEALLLSYSIRL